MKLHLPKLLRNSVLACITAVAGIATTTVGTATFTGGVVAFALAGQQVLAETTTLTEADATYTYSVGNDVVVDVGADNFATINIDTAGTIRVDKTGDVDETGFLSIASGKIKLKVSGEGTIAVLDHGNASNSFLKGGSIEVSNGATLVMSNFDAIGWSTSQSPNPLTLTDAEWHIAGRQSTFIPINLNGNTVVKATDAEVYPHVAGQPPSLHCMSGAAINATGTSNLIDSSLTFYVDNNMDVNVAESGELKIAARVTTRDGSGGEISKKGAGVVRYTSTAATANALFAAYNQQGGTSVFSGTGVNFMKGINISGGTLTVDADTPMTLGGTITMTGGTLDLNSAITISSLANFTHTEGEFSGTQNGLTNYASTYHLLTGGTNTGTTTKVTYDGAEYNLSDGITLNLQGYLIAEGTVNVGGSSPAADTAGATRFHVNAGATMNLGAREEGAALTVEQVIQNTSGTGTIAITQESTILTGAGGSAAPTVYGFDGTIDMGSGAKLYLGTNDHGPQKGNSLDMSGLSINLNGGGMEFNGDATTVGTINVKSSDELHLYDSPGTGSVSLTVNTLNLEADLLMTRSWKGRIDYGILTGAGNLTIDGNSDYVVNIAAADTQGCITNTGAIVTLGADADSILKLGGTVTNTGTLTVNGQIKLSEESDGYTLLEAGSLSDSLSYGQDGYKTMTGGKYLLLDNNAASADAVTWNAGMSASMGADTVTLTKDDATGDISFVAGRSLDTIYHVNTVDIVYGGENASENTERATGFAIADGRKVTIAGAASTTAAGELVFNTTGSGTIEIYTNTTLSGISARTETPSRATLFAGTISVKNGTLNIADEGAAPNKKSVDLRSLKAIEIDGGNVRFHGADSYIGLVDVKQAGTFSFQEADNSVRNANGLSISEIALNDNLVFQGTWGTNFAIAKLSGSGDISLNKGAYGGMSGSIDAIEGCGALSNNGVALTIGTDSNTLLNIGGTISNSNNSNGSLSITGKVTISDDLDKFTVAQAGSESDTLSKGTDGYKTITGATYYLLDNAGAADAITWNAGTTASYNGGTVELTENTETGDITFVGGTTLGTTYYVNTVDITIGGENATENTERALAVVLADNRALSLAGTANVGSLLGNTTGGATTRVVVDVDADKVHYLNTDLTDFTGTLEIQSGRLVSGNANINGSGANKNISITKLIIGADGEFTSNYAQSPKTLDFSIDMESGAVLSNVDGNVKYNGDIRFNVVDPDASEASYDSNGEVIIDPYWGKNIRFSGVLAGAGTVKLHNTRQNSETTDYNVNYYLESAEANTFTGTYELCESGTGVNDADTINLYVQTATALNGASVNMTSTRAKGNLYLGANSELVSLDGVAGAGNAVKANAAAVTLTVSKGNYGGRLEDGGNNVLSLTKKGAETLTLSGAIGYTGATSVQGGTLAFTGTDALTLGSIDVAAGGKITTASALTLAAGASLSLDLTNASAAGDAIIGVGAGALTLTDATCALSLSNVEGLSSGDYKLISWVAANEALTLDKFNITGVELDGNSDYSVEIKNNALILTKAYNDPMYWIAGTGTWAEGTEMDKDGLPDSSDTIDFANGALVVFGNITADESVSIEGALQVSSATIDPGTDMTYTFTRADNASSLSVKELAIESGTVTFNAGTLNLSAITSLTVDGALDLKSFNTNTVFVKLVGLASGDGVVMLAGGNSFENNVANRIDMRTIGIGGETTTAAKFNIAAGLAINAWVDASSPAANSLNIAKDFIVGGELRLESNAVVKVTGGTLSAGTIGLGHSLGNDTVELNLGGDATITAGGIVNTAAGTHKFTMTSGTLELTGTGGIAEGIATTVTGGTLVANTASWGITGATIGGATVAEDGTLSCAVQIQTAGLDTDSADDDKRITLTDATLTGTLDNSAGKLVLAGNVTINGEGFNKQTTLQDFSNGGTDGFATTDTYYQIVTTAGNLSIADGATWNMGEYVSSGEKAGWVRVDGTEYGTTYYLNTANSTTTLAAIKTHASTSTAYTLKTVALNGGNLEIAETDAVIDILGKADGTIKLTDATLKSSQVNVDPGKTVKLTGNGVYDLGEGLATLGTNVSLKGSTSDDDKGWTGTVKLYNINSDSSLDLNNFGNDGSTVSLAGVTTWIPRGTTVATKLLLEKKDNLNGFSIHSASGYSDTVYTFSNAISGSGDLIIAYKSDNQGSPTYAITGDTSEWSGGFVVVAPEGSGNTQTVGVKFTSGGQLFEADAKGIEMNRGGIFNVTIGAEGKESNMNAAITNNGTGELNLSTIGTTNLEAAVKVTKLTNTGTLTINGTLAGGAALNNTGSLTLTQEETTLASLVGTGSITAKSMVLQGAQNTMGSLTLADLTLGTADAASKLTVDTLNITGNLVVNKLAGNSADDATASIILTSTAGLADSLNLKIAENVLFDGLTRQGLTSLVIADIEGLDITKVTLNGSTSVDSGQYTYSINQSAATGKIELLVVTNGATWGEFTKDPDAENYDPSNNWKNPQNWDGVAYPGDSGTEQAVKFLGDGSSEVVIGESMNIKYITIDIDGYNSEDTTLDAADPKKAGYEFTADGDTYWNVLNVSDSLSVNKGKLTVGENVNIEAEKNVEILANGILQISQQSFVNANGGINNAGSVVIDASTNPENHGALYVQGGGSVVNTGTMEVNGTLFAGYGQLYDSAGSDIINSGILESTGTVLADGNLDNSGTLAQSGGTLTVKGNLNNTGTATIEMKEVDGAAEGAIVTVGTLTNDGIMSVDGSTMDITGSVYLDANDAPVTILPALINKADAKLDIIGGGAVTVNSMVTDDNEYQGRLTNSGSITIGSAAEGETPATSGTLAVQGSLENQVTGSITLVQGSLDVDGELANSGALSISGGTAAAGSVDNDATITLTGGSLTADDMTNSGTLTIVGGTVTVGDGSTITDADGNTVLDDTLTNSGTITIGTAAEGETPATTGSLVVNGDLANSGADNNIVVNDKSTLTVTGDLNAADMDLGFDGKVTVGGTATMDNLTIQEGAEFTAENATIADTLDNDGKLTVTTTKVTADDGTVTYEGGKLSIGTLTGSGEVHVQEGGALSIVDSVEFTGVLDNKGSMEFTATDAVVTLKNTQAEGQTAGDLTAAGIKVTADATGYTPDGGKESSYVMGDIVTDSLTIDGIDRVEDGARLVLDSIKPLSAEEGAKVSLTLSQINDTTNGESFVSGIIDAVNADEAGEGELKEVNYHLMDIAGTTSLDIFELNIDADREQQILAAGQIAELWDGTNPEIALLAAGEGTDVYLKVREQKQAEATWDTSGTSTAAGLMVGTVTDGVVELKNADILDNVAVVNVTTDTTIDLTATDTAADNAVQIHGLSGTNALTVQGAGAAADYVAIDDHMDDAEGNAMRGELGGALKLKDVSATLELSGDTVDVTAGGVELGGTLTGGSIAIDAQKGIDGGSELAIDGTDLNISNYKGSADMTGVSETGQVLVDLGAVTGSADEITITPEKAEDLYLLDKYFTNVRFDSGAGAVVADRNTSYFSDNVVVESTNGEAGVTLADAALLKLNPQMDATSALGAMLTALENAGSSQQADELGAALAGASTAALGMAVSGDVDRQLKAIRNRTTTMGVDQSVVNEELPYFNAWINAEGDMRELNDSGTEGGYKLNSWGGTVGFDVDFTPTFTAGMAFTAMYGDLDVTGADQATGDLDSYYVSAFARYCDSAWTHTFVATVGTGDISLNRTVLGSQLESETDSLSFGLMYEVGRVFALNEEGSACLQPVFNVTWKHTSVDGYTEKGSDLALEVDEQTVDTVTFGVGARLQAVVGESMYNRTSILEARVLAKADVGDRNGSADVALAALPGTKAEVESAEMGAFGLEAGAGLTIPVGEEGGSIFMDASVELRSDYTNVNGTVGYRINF